MNKLTGSDFDDFLEEEGIKEEVDLRAQKKTIAAPVRDRACAAKLKAAHDAIKKQFAGAFARLAK